MLIDFIDPQGNYDLLKKHTKTDKLRTIIDIGAWWGPWTLNWHTKAKTVILFEPNIEILPKLQHNIKDIENCILHKVALGETQSRVSMITPDHSGTTHVLETHGEVECTTLDSYNFTEVDIIKIDVEGYEIPVLKGSIKTILKNKPLIQIECNKSGNKFGFSKMDIFNFLIDLGMKRLEKKWPDQIWSF